jgi:hypothetical protein
MKKVLIAVLIVCGVGALSGCESRVHEASIAIAQ